MTANELSEARAILASLVEKYPSEKDGLAQETEIVRLLAESPFFDGNFYLSFYGDVDRAKYPPALHYVRHGFWEGRAPSAKFSQLVCVDKKADKNSSLLQYLQELLKHCESKQTPVEQPKSQGTERIKPQIYRQGSFDYLYDFPLHIDWLVTDMCNYKCSYCFGQKPLDKKRFSTFAQIRKAIDHLYELRRNSYSFVLSGGEPTTHPDFNDLLMYACDTLREKLNYITIISNGSRQNRLYANIGKISRYSNINLNIFLHTEYVDMEHIQSVVEDISSSTYICFNLMLNPAKLDIARDIFAQLLKMRSHYAFDLNMNYIRLGKTYTIEKMYSPEFIDWRREALAKFKDIASKSGIWPAYKQNSAQDKFWDYTMGNDRQLNRLYRYDRGTFLKDGFFDFKGMHCAIGTSVIAIGAQGEVYGAQCELAPKKYNIFEVNPFRFDDFMQAINCSLETCCCGTNDGMLKFADEHEAQAYMEHCRRLQCRIIAQPSPRQG